MRNRKDPIDFRRPEGRGLYRAFTRPAADREGTGRRSRRLSVETLESRTLLAVDILPAFLEPQDPLGSLVYEATVDDQIVSVGETNTFTIDLDADQTLTLLVEPDPLLQPSLELLDPDSVVIGNASASQPGRDVLLQSVAAADPGTYTFSVSGAADSIGTYSVRLILNAALEEEIAGGADNNSQAAAQDIDPSFVSLGFDTAERGAVSGTFEPTRPANVGAAVNTADPEQNPALSADGLTLVFNSDRSGGAGGSDLYMATRASTSEPFGGVFSLGAEVNLASSESGPALSADGLALYFASDRAEGLGSNDLYVATRATTADPFGNVASLGAGVNTAENDNNPAVSADGLTLLWNSSRPGGAGSQDLYLATRATTADAFAGATNLGAGVNTTAIEAAPVLSGDGLSLYFHSNRVGGLGGHDLYVATRAELAAPFGNVANLGPAVNTAGNERAPGLFAAGDLVFFESNRPGGEGNRDLYEFALVQEDWYRFALDAGTSATLALAGADAGAETTTLTFDQNQLGYAGTADTHIREATPDDSFEDAIFLNVDADEPGGSGLESQALVRFDGIFGDFAFGDLSGQIAPDDQIVSARLELDITNLGDPMWVHRLLEPWAETVTWNGFGGDGIQADGVEAAAAPEALTPPPTTGTLSIDVTASLQAWQADPTTNFGWVLLPIGGNGVDFRSSESLFNPPKLVVEVLGSPSRLELVDAAGNLLARGTAAAGNVDQVIDDQVIDDFVAPATGSYFARVGGRDARPYVLVVSRDATFDSESGNGPDADGQDITLTGTVLGHAGAGAAPITTETEPNDDGIPGGSTSDLPFANDWSSSFLPVAQDRFTAGLTGSIATGDDRDWDFFKILAGPGDVLAVQMRGAPSGAGTLGDPYLRLFDNSGRQVAANDDTFGLESFIRYSNFAYAGDYYVVADSYGSSVGTYRLNATLITANPQFQVRDDDLFRVEAVAGDALALATRIPAAGPGLFQNDLDLAIELFDPASNLVASSADGSLNHTAALTGTYTVRVTAENDSSGEYVLDISGHTGDLPPFVVTASDPADGELLVSSPAAIVLELSDQVLVSSVDASDLAVDGQLATGVTVLASGALAFIPPPLADGLHTLSVAAGAWEDLQGQPVGAFTSGFTTDTLGPRVTSVSVQEDDTFSAGAPMVVTVGFDEPLEASALDSSDVLLQGNVTGPISPILFDYDPASSVLTLEFGPLAEDQYTLTLTSGDGAFEDLLGNDLDGEPLAFPIPPNASGDGIPGGDFSVRFATDIVIAPYPAPVDPKLPRGSLVYDPGAEGLISLPGDHDTFFIDLDANQSITLLVQTDASLRASVEIADADGTVIAIASATAAGDAILLQTVAATTSGRYLLTVRGAGGTTGMYSARLTLNAALEAEAHGGPTNDDLATAEDIDASFISLGFDAAERGAVLGTLPSTLGIVVDQDDFTITTPGPTVGDWYHFTLEDGQSATVAVAALSAGNVTVDLYDASGQRLATAAGAANVDAVISNFVDTTSDGLPASYFVEVSGQDADYSLVVTRDADFDTEPNNDLAIEAQGLPASGAVLAFLGGPEELFGAAFRGPSGLAELYQLDPATGQATQVGPIGFERVSAIDSHPATGILYGVGERADGSNTSVLISIDPLTGAGSEIGPVGLSGPVSDISFRSDGVLFAYEAFQPSHSVATIDLATGQGTRLGPSSFIFTGGNAIAFDPQDTLFQSTFHSSTFASLNTLDQQTGAATFVSELFFPPPATNVPRFNGFDYNPGTGILYGSLNDGSRRVPENYLATVDTATGNVALIGATVDSLDALAWSQGTDGSQGDFYSVPVVAGDNLHVATATPGGGPFEFLNTLDPALELYDPTGAMVASDANSADGRNAQLTHTAALTGTYTVRVLAEDATLGEYVLAVSGNSGAAVPFEVAATDPADGALLGEAPGQITVDFNAPLLLTTLDAADLTVDGVPATQVTVVDSDTAIFDLPALADGEHLVAIAGAAIQNLQGQDSQAFGSSFTVDTTAPRVVATSIQQGDIVPVSGDLVVTVQFDEPLDADNLDGDAVQLVGLTSGGQAPSELLYDPATSTLMLTFASIPEDTYTLTLTSGDGAFEDLVGNDLDGEPLAFPIPPNTSGDGVAGGNFAVQFSTDFLTVPYPTPLEAKAPLGALVFDPPASGMIHTPGDTDSFAIDVDDGQTITVVVQGDDTLQASIALSDPGGVELASAAATAVGRSAVIQAVATVGAGTYTVAVGGEGGTTGQYEVSLILNAAAESEAHGGPANDSQSTAQQIDASFISLGFGTAERGAVSGSLEPARPANVGTGVNTAAPEQNPAVSADGLTLVFSSDRPGGAGGSDLYMATRASTSEPFGGVVSLGAEVNSASSESGPALSADGLALYFASDRAGGLGSHDLYVATRATTADPFGSVTSLGAGVNTPENDNNPAVSADGLTLLWNSSRPGGAGSQDLYLATRATTADAFAGATNLGAGVNTTAIEAAPVLSGDGLSLYFHSNRVGGLGGHDLYVATRAELAAPFGYVANLGPAVNTASSERAPSLFAAGDILFFESGRPGGEGNRDLYEFALVQEDWYRFVLDAEASATLALAGADAAAETTTLTFAQSQLGYAGTADTHIREATPDNSFENAIFLNVDASDDGGEVQALVRFDGIFGDLSGQIAPEDQIVSARLELQITGPGEPMRVYRMLAPWAETVTWNAFGGDGIQADGVEAAAVPDTVTGWPSVGRLSIDVTASLEAWQADPAANLGWALLPTGIDGVDFRSSESPFDPPQLVVSVIGSSNRLELFDAAGNLLARGRGDARNVDQVIEGFVAPEAGDYFARITGSAGSRYNLVVTRDATFDLEPNDAPDTEAQDITQAGTALGHVLNRETDGGVIDDDGYQFEVNEQDVLTIRTLTPGDGPLEPVNLLDPTIELYDPDGNLVASDDNSAADGRNAFVTHTAAATGTYRLKVAAVEGTAGAYVVDVRGQSGLPAPFEVLSVDLADGGRFGTVPVSLTVDFNDTVRLDTLAADDLKVDGIPASAVDVLDGDTARFQLPPLGEGVHDVAIGAGSILDLQGTPIEFFVSQFTIDLTPPRVSLSSLQDGDLSLGDAFTYVAVFDEPLRQDDLDPSDVRLVGESSGLQELAGMDYDPATSRLTLQYEGLLEDRYTLTLTSGDGALEDLVGHDLDGEPLAFPVPPAVSGDGVAGGDFVLGFEVDRALNQANEFARLAPLGSLMFLSDGNSGRINTVGDEDDFRFFLEGGQSLSAVVTPLDAGATLQVSLVGGGGVVTAPEAGAAAVLPPVAVAGDDIYRIRVSGDGPTGYALDIYRNAALEAEVGDSSASNPLPIDGSFVSLGSGRFGAVGRSDPTELEIDSVVFAVQPATGDILKIDPATGDVLDSFAAPDALAAGHTRIGLSLAEGGRALVYVNSDVDPSLLWRLDPITGRVLSIETRGEGVVDGLGVESSVAGPASPADSFLFLSHSNVDIHRQEGFSGPETHGWATREPVGALGGDDAGRQFGYFFDGLIHEYDPFVDTNSLISTLAPPAADIEGLAYDGVNLYASTSSGQLFTLDPDTGDVWGVVSIPGGGIYGLGAGRSAGAGGESIANGGFETGNFTDWTVTNSGSGDWQINDGSFNPPSPGGPLEPISGNFDAVSFQNGGGLHVLSQSLVVPPNVSSATLRWSDRIRNHAGEFSDPNQEWRVLIADNGGNTIQEVFSTDPGDPTQQIGPNERSFDLTSLFGDLAGQTVEVRFEQQDNLFFFNATLDDVSLEVTAGHGLIPDQDLYTVDLTGRAGDSIDVILASQDGTDFSTALLELVDVDGSTVLATAAADPLGVEAANYDLGIIDFVVPADGVYHLRLRSPRPGQYGLLVTDSITFDTEINDQLTDPLRRLDGAGTTLGFLGTDDGVAGGVLYGSDRNGTLFTIDLGTGAGTLVGPLPAASTEIEFDPLTGRAFSQLPDGAFSGLEFDIATGGGVGGTVSNGFAFNGLEWVGADLYGTATTGPGSDSQLRLLDPFAGSSVLIGATGVGPISGLAYQARTDTLLGIAGGPGPAALYTIDRDSGVATPIGSTGIQAGSLEFGPDGNLYAGGTGGTGGNAGQLYRIDPLTAASTLVGLTGFGPVTGLLLGPEVAERPLIKYATSTETAGAEEEVRPHRAALTTYLPKDVSWRDVAAQLTLVSPATARKPSGTNPAGLVVVAETEPNDTIETANPVPLGFGPGQDEAVDVNGTLTAGPPPSTIFPLEEDGAIPFATVTGLAGGDAVTASAVIGDGAFGLTTGDYDWYAIEGITVGQQITVDVDAEAIGSSLDPFVGLYDSSGALLAQNDDFDGLDSFLSFVAPSDDDYFVVVRGYGGDFQADPFDPASGTGVASTGPYRVTIGLDVGDIDFFQLDLEAGDILGANVIGAAGRLSLRDGSGSELMGSSQDAMFIHPAASPLPGGGNAALSWVVDTPGTYYIAAQDGSGAYDLQLRVFRPVLEDSLAGTHQILLLDFDGATIDTSIFGAGGLATLSPLSTFLPGWGLEAADEDAVIDAIVAAVEENLSSDLRLAGNNGDFDATGVPGQFDIEIRNSRDDGELFGLPNVSRVVVGGTIGELGIGTIGIAESIDVGNFETEETAVVLLDLLSAPASDPNSLNQYGLDPSVSIIDLVGVGVGNIVGHEAGHFFANWHTDQLNDLPNLMDQGGSLDNTVGVGPDRIFGSADDADVDFGDDTFVPNEGFSGTEDTLNAIAFGLSTGTIDPLLVGPQVIGIDPRAGLLVNVLDVETITVEFSEQIAEWSLLDAANYQFLEAGANGLFEGGLGDDVVIPLAPSSSGGGLVVDLAVADPFTPLRIGSYQFTIDGSDTGIVDLDGNPLGTTTGPGGGQDVVHPFEITFELEPGGDIYEIDLVAGQIFTARTDTPFDSTAASPANDLDLRLVVLDPAGQPVAGDADSRDGKNAELHFAAAETGSYFVQVLREAGAGEYLLGVEVLEAGDMNADGEITFSDIDPFVQALESPATYVASHNIPPELIGDLDSDGDFDFDDIGPFARLLTGGPLSATSSTGPASVSTALAVAADQDNERPRDMAIGGGSGLSTLPLVEDGTIPVDARRLTRAAVVRSTPEPFVPARHRVLDSAQDLARLLAGAAARQGHPGDSAAAGIWSRAEDWLGDHTWQRIERDLVAAADPDPDELDRS